MYLKEKRKSKNELIVPYVGSVKSWTMVNTISYDLTLKY